MDELATILDKMHIGVAAVTETWTKEHVSSGMLDISGFRCLRHDRQGEKKGGGVVAYVRDITGYDIQEWATLHDENIESLWFRLRPPKLPREFTCLVFGIIYHPPGADHRALQTHLLQSMDTVRRSHPQSGFIITGDFNQFPDK